MNKNLLKSILTSALVIFFLQSVFSAPVAPVRTLEIPWANPAPTLDGLADEAYSVLQTTNIFNAIGRNNGDADFTAVFRLCMDPSYLYVLVEITDDINHSYQEGVGNSWEFDNFELFLQLDTNTVTTAYGATTVQLRFNRGLDSVESWGRANREDFGYYMESNTASGWITEVAVPWTAALAEGAAPEDMQDYIGRVIGFDFAGADSDNSDGNPDVGNRDAQSAWDDDDPSNAVDRTEDLAWNNTSVFGYLYLGLDCCSPGIINDFKEQSIKTAPNPAGDNIRLLNVEQTSFLTIYNMQGAAVMVTEYHPDQELDISGLKSGMYTVVIDGMQGGRFIKH